MDLNERIAQFENMAQADASNEMAHFSLGGAYSQAGRHADAAAAYMRCAAASPDMSKAYQLAAESYVKAGMKEESLGALRRGYDVAVRRGDRMPRQAMERLFEQLGERPPHIEGAPPVAEQASEGSFICAKTGRGGTQLSRPPFKGPVGAWIQQNISEQTWQEWIRQGTKVINELRLDLSRDADADTYDRYMREYLGIDDALYARLRGAPASV